MSLTRAFSGIFAAGVLAVSGTAVAYDPAFDYNGDGVVDAVDVEMIKAAFNTAEGDLDYDPIFDHDGDGFVGGSDISAAQAAAGTSQD